MSLWKVTEDRRCPAGGVMGGGLVSTGSFLRFSALLELPPDAGASPVLGGLPVPRASCAPNPKTRLIYRAHLQIPGAGVVSCAGVLRGCPARVAYAEVLCAADA